MRVIEFLFGLGPILFGLAFLGPVMAAAMDHFGLGAPLGLSALQFGAAVGGLLGVVARQRRTWLW